MKKPYIIAEIGFNHGGDIDLAEEMVKAAASAGADAVKFQSFRAGDLYLESNEVYGILKPGELSEEDHVRLKKLTDLLRIDFLSTPFSVEMVDMLNRLKVKGFKVASMDLNNNLLLKAVARKKKIVYLSTGGGDIGEVRRAVKVLKSNGAKKVVVLHCISNYPTLPKDIHLEYMSEIKEKIGVAVGFSDHSLGISASLAAIAFGAEVIEKHFTTDKSLEGPDHKISIDPAELRELVDGAEVISAAMTPLPKTKKRPDAEMRKLYRRGIYAARPIKKGDKIVLEDLKFVRPALTPLEKLSSIVGKKAKKSYAAEGQVK